MDLTERILCNERLDGPVDMAPGGVDVDDAEPFESEDRTDAPLVRLPPPRMAIEEPLLRCERRDAPPRPPPPIAEPLIEAPLVRVPPRPPPPIAEPRIEAPLEREEPLTDGPLVRLPPRPDPLPPVRFPLIDGALARPPRLGPPIARLLT
jgi:hypothetical protein